MKNDKGLGSRQRATRKRKCAAIDQTRWKVRTLEELPAAVVYLEIMEKESEHDPDEQKGQLVGTAARKGREMLLWAAGEDNTFGQLILKFVGSVKNDDTRTMPPNPAAQPNSTTKES
jgi:hypothetical protein